MKTIIILNLLAFFSILSFGQLRDTTIEIQNKKVKMDYDVRWNKQELKKNIEEFKEDYNLPSFKSSTNITNILNSIPLSADGCVNGGFENNFTGWTGLSLKHSLTTTPIENGLSLNTGILPLPFTNVSYGGNYTNIENAGTDNVLTNATPSFLLQKVRTGNKSIRLGNNERGRGSEGIAKRFVVTSQNAKYYFQYAVVMDRSHSNVGGSSNGSEVFFVAEAVDMNGSTIDKIVDIGNPSNPFVTGVSSTWGMESPPNNVYYRDWRCAYLDLSGFIGQEVVVMFINADCAAGGHKGYTYVDAVCESCININEGDININLSPDSCFKFPQKIGGTFTLPASGTATNSSITLQVFQNNALVTTITNPTITGSNYNFTLNASDFPSQNVGDCYDLVSALSFQIPDMNGVLQTVTQLSSPVVGGVQDGENPGQNNDACFCVDNTPPTCCDIQGLSVLLIEKNGKYELTISSGASAIQEVEVSMMDYHVEYSEPDCKPANMGMFGIISSTTSNFSTLLLDPASNNSQSLSWLPGSPSVLNSNVINLEVTKPAVLDIKCCDVKFTFCLKVTVKDINCNVCEIIVCPIKDWALLSQNKILSGEDDPVNVALNEGRKNLSPKFGGDVESWYKELKNKSWISLMLKKYPNEVKSLLKVGRRLIQGNGNLERSDMEIIEKSMRLLDREVANAPKGFIEEALTRLRSSIGKNWKQLMEEFTK